MGILKAGTVGAHVEGDVIAEIDRRADALSMGRSGYAAHVYRWWKAQGYPAVTPADQAMQDIRALERLKVAEDKPAGRASRKAS